MSNFKIAGDMTLTVYGMGFLEAEGSWSGTQDHFWSQPLIQIIKLQNDNVLCNVDIERAGDEICIRGGFESCIKPIVSVSLVLKVTIDNKQKVEIHRFTFNRFDGRVLFTLNSSAGCGTSAISVKAYICATTMTDFEARAPREEAEITKDYLHQIYIMALAPQEFLKSKKVLQRRPICESAMASSFEHLEMSDNDSEKSSNDSGASIEKLGTSGCSFSTKKSGRDSANVSKAESDNKEAQAEIDDKEAQARIEQAQWDAMCAAGRTASECANDTIPDELQSGIQADGSEWDNGPEPQWAPPARSEGGFSDDSDDEEYLESKMPLLNLPSTVVSGVSMEELYHCYMLVQKLKESADTPVMTDLDSQMSLKCSRSILIALSPAFRDYFKTPEITKLHYTSVAGKVLRQVVDFLYTGRLDDTREIDLVRMMIYGNSAQIPALCQAILRRVNKPTEFLSFFAEIRKISRKKYVDEIEASLSQYLTETNFHRLYRLMNCTEHENATQWCLTYFKAATTEQREKIMKSTSWHMDEISDLIDKLIKI